MKRKYLNYLIYVISAWAMLLVCGCRAEAGSVFESPFVKISPDGEAWTMYQRLPDYGVEGFPGFWYDSGDDFRTGIPSALRAPGAGEHYYKYARNGMMPVGGWRVAWKQPRCIQGADVQAVGHSWHGLKLGDHRCLRPYFSGWFAWCADCQEPVRVNIYMSREAAHSVTYIPLGMAYYYLCPRCEHLEQGAEITHDCKAVSYNRYAVRYIKNGGPEVGGYMPDSLHMYNNAEVFEGNRVVPARKLSQNGYTRLGYRFTGWNTEPDGTGDFFADGAEIFNLTDENYDEDAGTGVVALYAQWETVQSRLVFDANGGSYTGENPVKRGYGTVYILDESKGTVHPPAGHTVSFETDGGSALTAMENTLSFVRWDLKAPLGGEYIDNRYRFTGPMDAIDTAAAVYAPNPIVLPAPEKPNTVFGGWYADEALTVLVGYEGDEFIPAENVTLYARWVELKLYSANNNRDNGGRGAVDLSWSQPDREGKSYRLYQSEDGGGSYAQISSVSASTEAEELMDRMVFFEKEGNQAKAQTLLIPSSGIYELKAEAAQGGGFGDYKGGRGGSVSGRFYLTEGEAVTFLVGAQDGTGGGGEGAVYGNGGGMTLVFSDRKGILLAAGGGGGAGAAGDGRPGGSGTNLLTEGNTGESGMSGGGGGYLGGAAGEYIVHNHKEDCFVRGSDRLYYGYSDGGEYNDGNPEVWQEDEDSDVYTHIRLQKTITDFQNYDVLYAEYTNWSAYSKSVKQEEACVRLLDQNGRELASVRQYDLLNRPVFANGSSIRGLVHNNLGVCESYEWNWAAYGDRLASFTFEDQNVNMQFSYVPTEGSYSENGEPDFEHKGYRVIFTPVTDGVKNWINLMVLRYDNHEDYEYYPGWESDRDNCSFEPLKVDPRYILYTNDRGKNRYMPEGICSEVSGRWEPVVYGGESWITDNYSLVCRVAYYNDDTDITAVTAQSLFVVSDSHYNAAMSVRGDYKRQTCGFREGQAVSARPAYGGSNYINSEYAITGNSACGTVEGDGSAVIRAVSAGMTEAQELKGVKAPDRAAPYPVAEDGIRKTAVGSDSVLVSFDRAEDRGTEYYFYAESCSMRTGELMCTSNTARNILKTGVKEYFYLIDREPETVLTGTESRLENRDGLSLMVPLKSWTQYLHLAAADGAGNLSETTHVEIRMDDPMLFWPPYTEQMKIDSVVGDRDYGNVYPADEEKTCFVKADANTPFLLSFDSYIEGAARETYQINYQKINALPEEGAGQTHTAVLPYTVPLNSEEPLDGSVFEKRTEGAAVLRDAMYMGARRSSQAERVSFYEAFTLDGSLNGRVITVTPTAGAGTGRREAVYSDGTLDAANGLRLIADGEAPAITGLEAFQAAGVIDRTQGSIALEVRAEDALSGVRDFYLQVENLDNYGSRIYRADEDGLIRVEITKTEALFSGDFSVTGYAVDNVGNEIRESWYVTEFSLEAEVERILSPHEPVFKRGESGILAVDAWGYVDRVEVEFPDFLSAYDRVFDYTDAPDYRRQEKIQFMIPLYAPEGSDYEITVRAYKGDRRLEEHPSIRTINVEGSVLDEIRTRLRG